MKKIIAKRIIPIATIDNAADAVPLAGALRDAGLNVIEITFRTDAAEQAVRNITREFADMCVGAGTLLTVEQVRRAKDAGAFFGVSPGLREQIISEANTIGLAFIPGVMTPTEVEFALSLDCRILKFFPADVAGGTKMLQSWAGPYAHTGVKFVPLGGINTGNMSEYLALPIVAAIGGSWLADRKRIANKDWKTITALAAEALKIAGS